VQYDIYIYIYIYVIRRLRVKESRSQAVLCNDCATVTRGQRCEMSKLLHVASE